MNGEEVKEKRKKLGLTQEELAKKIGVTKKTIVNYENGEVIPQSKEVILHSVLNPIIKEYSNIESNLSVEEEVSTYQSKKKDTFLPLIPIEAMAGFGEGEQQLMSYEGDRFIVPLFKGADFLISVKGSSMYPKYNSGDIVACKKLSINDIFFQWNKVYVIDSSQGALIKRVKKGNDNNSILLYSDNEKFEPFELSFNQINSIALVIGVIRLE